MENSDSDRFGRLCAHERGNTGDRTTGREGKEFQKFASLHGNISGCGVGDDWLASRNNVANAVPSVVYARSLPLGTVPHGAAVPNPVEPGGPAAAILVVSFFTFGPDMVLFDQFRRLESRRPIL